MANVFTTLLEQGAKQGYEPARTQTAREWFREQAEQVIIRNRTAVITSAPVSTSRTQPGFLYLFSYEAQTKNLPYHDKYPLVFPFRRVKGGFYGINMHYLPLEYRALLMDRLYDLTVDDDYDVDTKLRITYRILEGSQRFRFFKPCIRHYLNNNVRSRFALIPSNQWDIALFLPLERFVKPSGGTYPTQRVHLDTTKKIRRGS